MTLYLSSGGVWVGIPGKPRYGPNPGYTPTYDVLLTTSSNYNSVIWSQPGGTRFAFEAGVHRLPDALGFIGNGNQYLGFPGAILSGAKLLPSVTGNTSQAAAGTHWHSPSSGLWYIGNQTQRLPVENDAVMMAGATDGANRGEDVYLNDVRLEHVDSTGAVGPGKFHFDYGNNRIYIGDNPAGQKVEATVIPNAITAWETDDLVFRNLIIEKFGPAYNDGALRLIDGAGHSVIDCEVRLNHASGVWHGPGSTIRGTWMHDNGQYGSHGSGPGVTIEDCRWSDNAWIGYDIRWAAAANKYAFCDGLTIRRNLSDGNRGIGIWTDIDNENVVIEDNEVLDCTHMGIFHEVSHSAVIRRNLIHGCGSEAAWWGEGVAIQVSCCEDVEIYENVGRGNSGGAVGLFEFERFQGDHLGALTGDPYLLRNIDVHDNDMTVPAGGFNGGESQITNPGFAAMGISFQGNTYWVPNLASTLFQWEGLNYTFANWQASPRLQDTTGSASTSTPPDGVSPLLPAVVYVSDGTDWVLFQDAEVLVSDGSDWVSA